MLSNDLASAAPRARKELIGTIGRSWGGCIHCLCKYIQHMFSHVQLRLLGSSGRCSARRTDDVLGTSRLGLHRGHQSGRAQVYNDK